MVYLISFIMILFATLIGKVFVELFEIKKYKHASIYGVLIYFTGFFILSGVFTFLHLSWNFYFWTMTLYNIILLALIIYFYWTKKVALNLSIKALGKYVIDNWAVLFVITSFILLYLSSQSNFIFTFDAKYSFARPIIDDVSYLARASSGINSMHLFPNGFNPVSGEFIDWRGSDYLLLVSFWELFWGYGSAFFHLDLIPFTRICLAILVFIITFLVIDELLYLCFDKKIYAKSKYVILAFLLMYLLNGMQWETSKFMFIPWFGNVYTTMLYIPYLVVISYQAIHHKKMLALLFLFPFISVGFTTVSMVYTAFLLPLSFYFVKKDKRYSLNYEKIWTTLSIITILIFAVVAVYGNTDGFGITLAEIIFSPDKVLPSEKVFFVASMTDKLLLILPGILLLLYRRQKQEVSHVEETIIFYIGCLILIAIVPFLGNGIFNLFSFSLRRLLESLLIVLVIYSCLNLCLCFSEFKVKHYIVPVLVLVLVFNKTQGFFIWQQRSFFKLENLFSTARVLPAAEELTNYFRGMDETQKVCVHPDRSVETAHVGEYVELGSAITQMPQHYLVFRCTNNSGFERPDYVVAPSNIPIDELPSDLQITANDLVEVIETDELSLNIYKVN